MAYPTSPRLKVGCGLALLLLALAVTQVGAQQGQPSDKPSSDPETEVLPVSWRGAPDVRSGLEHRESLLRGGEKGPVIVPGNAEASRLYRRIAGLEKPAMPMAPLPPLTAQQVAVLKSWIDQGAKWGPM